MDKGIGCHKSTAHVRMKGTLKGRTKRGQRPQSDMKQMPGRNSRQRRLVRGDLPLRTPRRGSGKSEQSQ